jgi:predicted nucleotidyltransferase
MKGARWAEMRLAFPTNKAGHTKSGIAFGRMLPDCEGYERVDFLFTGEDAYLKSVVENAPVVLIQGISLKVVRPEDIIVMKELAARDKDIADVMEIRRMVAVDEKYIRQMLEKLA